MKIILFSWNFRMAAVIACGICAVTGIRAFTTQEFNPQRYAPGFGPSVTRPASQYLRLNVTNVAPDDLNGFPRNAQMSASPTQASGDISHNETLVRDTERR